MVSDRLTPATGVLMMDEGEGEEVDVLRTSEWVKDDDSWKEVEGRVEGVLSAKAVCSCAASGRCMAS
jgi:hypothetical protein